MVRSVANCYIIMFCCVRKETHKGEIVTAVCLESQCVKAKNQLSCVVCLQQQHQGHTTTSMRKLVPELLNAHTEKLVLENQLERLLEFVVQEFGAQLSSGETVTRLNVVPRCLQLLQELKREVQINNEEMNKMKSIFKSLNKNSSNIIPRTSPSKYTQQSYEQLQNYQKLIPSGISSSPSKSNHFGSPSKSKAFSSNNNNNNGKLDFDTFSLTSKHPYLNLSNDFHSVTKVSHSGHRFAAIGAKPFSLGQRQLRVKIDKSVSGNIMLGLCHQNIVREKQFANCYGINNGTYLIGQNGNNPLTAISFHHSLTVLNRKEVIGWNFQEGDEILIGLNFEEELIYFRREGKRSHVDFSMKLKADNKPTVNLTDPGLKLIVLLQSQGDQVTILQI